MSDIHNPYDEGSVKFHADWIADELQPNPLIDDLVQYRQRVFDKGWIGVYPNGIGYGNISLRNEKQFGFYISAAATGHITQSSIDLFSEVVEYDIINNWVRSRGKHQASSESMTHAALYQCNTQIQAIIHIHHHDFWVNNRGKYPCTDSDIAYGTPAMAIEMKRLYEQCKHPVNGLFLMGGHEDGIIAFGKSLPNAYQVLEDKGKELRLS